METCANCGRAIGKLETPRTYKKSVVCDECWQRLQPPKHEMERPLTGSVLLKIILFFIILFVVVSALTSWRQGNIDRMLSH